MSTKARGEQGVFSWFSLFSVLHCRFLSTAVFNSGWRCWGGGGTTRSVQNWGRWNPCPVAVGQCWGEKVSLGNRGYFCSWLSSQEDGPVQQSLKQTPQFALKVSSGTFQFSLSPPFVSPCGTGSLGEFSHFSHFFWSFSCWFLAIVLQEKPIPSSGLFSVFLIFQLKLQSVLKLFIGIFFFFPEEYSNNLWVLFLFHIIQHK